MAHVFDRELVAKQLSYNGALQIAKIRQAGYPVRMHFRDFADRYFLYFNFQSTVKKKQYFDQVRKKTHHHSPISRYYPLQIQLLGE